MQEDCIRGKRLHREQRQSGLSIVRFCRSPGVSPGSFHRWRRVLAADTAPARGGDLRPGFVELASPPSIAGPAAVIVLEGGPPIELAPGTGEAWVVLLVVLLVGRLERRRDDASF